MKYRLCPKNISRCCFGHEILFFMESISNSPFFRALLLGVDSIDRFFELMLEQSCLYIVVCRLQLFFHDRLCLLGALKVDLIHEFRSMRDDGTPHTYNVCMN